MVDAAEAPNGVTRRRFLALLGAGAAASTLQPTWFDLRAVAAAAPPVDPHFPEGIASGDPLPDGSTIWTRVDPATDAGAGVPVTWEVAADDTFTSILATGVAAATADADHTVHVPVTGLTPDSWFHYRFRATGTAGEVTSRTGRLRTAPAVGSSPERLRFAFCSCQQINASYYVAHSAMAAEDLDFVAHYGDYVYVSDGGTITLDDYRAVYRRFKANPLLQELHATYPMVCIWDDGEFVNSIDAVSFPAERVAAAKQAWFEYFPVQRTTTEPDRLYRAFEWGNLADFLLLDLRSYRSAFVPPNDTSSILSTTDTNLPSGAVIFEPDRTSLGGVQKQWLKDRLLRTDHTWRHIGQGYQFLALRLDDYDTPEARANPPEGFHQNGGKYLSTELWDGYWAERRELMDFLLANEVPNVVVTAGQTHIFFAGGLRPDYDDLEGSPVVAREFVCGSLTADPDPRAEYFPGQSQEEAEAGIHSLEQVFLSINPHVDDIDLLNQGYAIVTFTPQEATVDFRVINTFEADAVATTRKSFTIAEGQLPELAPVEPPTTEPPTTEPPTTEAPTTAAPTDAPTTASPASTTPGTSGSGTQSTVDPGASYSTSTPATPVDATPTFTG